MGPRRVSVDTIDLILHLRCRMRAQVGRGVVPWIVLNEYLDELQAP